MSLCKSLPVELITLTGDFLPLENIKALRLSCRLLSSVFARRVLRTITIDFFRDNLGMEDSKLRLLSSGKSTANFATTRLVLLNLFLGDDNDFKAHFFETLRVLKSVETLSWAFPQSISYTSVHIEFVFECTPRPSNSLLSSNEEPHLRKTFDSVVEDMNHLGLHLTKLSKWPPTQEAESGFLSRLLDQYPSTKPPLCIPAIVLRNLIPHILPNTNTIRHLHQLTSFHLDHDLDHFHPENNAAVLLQMTDFWEALRVENICLHVIRVPMPTPSLMTYLASYSGLEELCLVNAECDWDGDEGTGRSFYSRVLLLHSNTLLYFDVAMSLTEDWQMCSEYIPIIRECKKLQRASFMVKGLGLDAGPSLGHLPQILEAFFCIPYLRKLNVHYDLHLRAFSGLRDSRHNHAKNVKREQDLIAALISALSLASSKYDHQPSSLGIHVWKSFQPIFNPLERTYDWKSEEMPEDENSWIEDSEVK